MKKLTSLLLLALATTALAASPNNDKPIENDPLIARLEGMGELPYPMCTWPLPPRITRNKALLEEFVRITWCASAGSWFNEEVVGFLVAAEPKLIGYNLSPYRGNFGNYRELWTKAEACGPLTPKDFDYFKWVWRRVSTFKEQVGDIPIVAALDYETGHLEGLWAGSGCDDVRHNEVLRWRLQIVYALVKQAFGGPVYFFNAHSHVPGSGLSIAPRNVSPIPEGVPSDYAALSWLRNPFSRWNYETLVSTAAATDRPLVLWLPIGGVLESWAYTPDGAPRRWSRNVTWPVSRGEQWYFGHLAFDAFPRRSEAKFGPLSRVVVVWIWPQLLWLDDDTLVWFLEGALGIRRPVEE